MKKIIQKHLSVSERLMLRIFLPTIPVDGLSQHMPFVEYRIILWYCLMIHLFPIDDICSVYHKTCLDTFGEHAVRCREFIGFKYLHDVVRDVLFDVCRCADIFVKKEAPMNFLTNPLDETSTFRPTDILVYRWI